MSVSSVVRPGAIRLSSCQASRSRSWLTHGPHPCLRPGPANCGRRFRAEAGVQKHPSRQGSRREPPSVPGVHPGAPEATCRKTGQRPVRIGSAGEDRNRHGVKDSRPTPPPGDLQEIVGTHDPHETPARVAALQLEERVGGVDRAEPGLEVRSFDAGMVGDLGRHRQALGKGRHAPAGLQRVLRRYEPPDLVQPQEVDRQEADMAMAVMGGIERAAEEADERPLPASPPRRRPSLVQGRICPVPRTRYL